MAAAETARLIASLELQDKNFTRGLRNVERGVGRVDKKLGAFSGFVNRNVGRALDSIALRATQAIGSGLEDLATLEDATTSVTGAIAQVGEGWATTGEQIATWANEIEADTQAAFDDKAIVAATTTLIRYGNISEKHLRPAMEVITDLAAKTGDVESASTKLAKALADPTKATRILREVGVRLTKSEEKRLKQLVKANKLGEAQALILELVGEKTEGAAEASAGPYRDAMNQMQDATEDAQKALAVGFLPVIKEVSGILTEELSKPETINALKGLGTALAETLRSLIGAAKQLPWAQIGDALKIAGTGAKAILDAFLGLPPWVQTAVITGWGLNKLSGGFLTNLASGLIKGALGIKAGVVYVNGPVAGGGAGAAPVGAAGKLMNAVKILGAVTIAGASIALLAQTFKGFIDDVGTAQAELLKDVNATSKQGFKETVANLEAVNSNVKNAGPLENLLKGVFGGSEIVRNYELAAGRIVGELEAGNLDRADMVKALDALKTAVETSPEAELPGVETAIDKLTAAIKATPAPRGAPGAHRPPPTPNTGGAPGAFRPVVTAVTAKGQATVNAINNAKSIATRENSAQKTELSNIKNATATLNTAITTKTAQQTAELANIKNASATLARKSEAQQTELSNIKNASATLNTSITTQTAQQTAELGNIKNATATMDTNTRAGLVAATAATTAGNLLSVFQSASQVLAATGTTTAARAAGVSAATASRNAGSTVSSAMSTAASRIVYAIAANRPIIQSTNVVNNFTRTQRSGATSGSRGGNSFSGYR